MKKISVFVFSVSLFFALASIVTACQPVSKPGMGTSTSPIITRHGKPFHPVSHFYPYIPVTGSSEFAPITEDWLGKVHLPK
jgi:hypothetical protein